MAIFGHKSKKAFLRNGDLVKNLKLRLFRFFVSVVVGFDMQNICVFLLIIIVLKLKRKIVAAG